MTSFILFKHARHLKSFSPRAHADGTRKFEICLSLLFTLYASYRTTKLKWLVHTAHSLQSLPYDTILIFTAGSGYPTFWIIFFARSYLPTVRYPMLKLYRNAARHVLHP